jgi:hypothetical protein
MIVISLGWIGCAVMAFCLGFISLVVNYRIGLDAYSLLSYPLPTVRSDASIIALFAMPVSVLASFLFGWARYEDDDYANGFLFMASPIANLVLVVLFELTQYGNGI